MDDGSLDAAAPVGTALFQPEHFAAIRAHPRFRETVEAHARVELARHQALPMRLRWLSRDLAGFALVGASLILAATPEGLTGRRLVEAVAMNRTCSRGRALTYLTRMLDWGYARLEPGEAPWTHRPVVLAEPFMDAFGPRRSGLFEAVAVFDPSLAGCGERALAPGAFGRFLVALAVLQPSRPDLFAGPDKPIMLFLARDAGQRILHDLICRQPAGRDAMLVPVRVSRSAMARDNNVSRTHVARLIADGEAQGLLREEGRWLVFSPELSADVERHYALIFELGRVAAHVAGLAGG